MWTTKAGWCASSRWIRVSRLLVDVDAVRGAFASKHSKGLNGRVSDTRRIAAFFSAMTTMSTANSHIECTDCGVLIDNAADTADGHVLCPNCGGTKRTVKLSAIGGQLSNYTLDNFVAHKLSLLTECGAQELCTNFNWLNTFVLTSVFHRELVKPDAVRFHEEPRRIVGQPHRNMAARKIVLTFSDEHFAGQDEFSFDFVVRH